jgi:hypothetical protein
MNEVYASQRIEKEMFEMFAEEGEEKTAKLFPLKFIVFVQVFFSMDICVTL